MKTNLKSKLNILVVAVLITVLSATPVYAGNDSDCDPEYGGGETCITNKRFKIRKEVRLEGDDTWRDKVYIDLTDSDEAKKEIEFRIEITNLSESEDNDADLSFDDMKMWDELPGELDRVGGSGLTEYWDDFDAGDEKVFIIKVKIDEDALDRSGDYTDCTVNRAEVYWDGEFEGSDSAAVCYSDEEVTELPDTGAFSTLSFVGLGLVVVAKLIKKSEDLFVA